MRIDVVARPAQEIKGDAIAAMYCSPLRAAGMPLRGHLRPGAARLLLDEEGATSWLEGRGTLAPRVLMACVGSVVDRRPRFGAAGAVGREDERRHARTSAARLGARIEQECHEQGVARLVVAPLPDAIDPGAFIEALIIRGHSNREFRRDASESTSLARVTLCVPSDRLRRTREQVGEAQTRALAVNAARLIADLPANVGTPRAIVERVRAIAQEVGLVVRTLGPAQMQRHRMGLIEAVTRGSEHPGVVLIVEHRPPRYRELPTLVIIGKGVVHDTGGYNLKRTDRLYRYTDDKAGAAAMVGAMQAIATLAIPLHVVGIAPIVENLLDATSYKPGDVLTAMDGTTVFVENTDAEGRLVLADCLTYAARFEPRMVIDIATLTGAAWAALGPAYAALFANDDDVRSLLVDAGNDSGDLVWSMPIHPAHDASLGHHLAELRNAGPREGEASTAAAFLRRFVAYPWAHIDMAGHGSSLVDRELMGAGATGFGTRLLISVAKLAAERWGSTA